eukprot:TRINITY_DN22420_c0_g1_i1.p1 TRINITY_DN22420_c0_g1~~TRINITY_DN22420_c0_g1_i1.p1  ORF type:complete len:871 (-),score=167.21 TRINITY_DN22420_c0_g1_i1:60-2570(-)
MVAAGAVEGDDDAEEAEAAGRGRGSFRIFSDRNAADLEAFEWNTSMDLLACLTAPPDSTLSIYRLLSEDRSPKLLSEKVTGVGTVLTWSPCGRKVAVGDRLGGISVFDGESGALLRSHRPHARPIVALSWVAASRPSDAALDPPLARMLPPLLAVPSAPSNMYAEVPESEAEPSDQLLNDGLSLLVSADETGLLVVSAGGTLSLLKTVLFDEPWWARCMGAPQLQDGQQASTWSVRSARLSPDLRLLAVHMSHSAASTEPSSSVSAGCDEVVVALDVRKFAVRRQELSQCWTMIERLLTTVSYAKQAVDALANVWRGAADAFAKKMRGLIEAAGMYDGPEGESTSVHQELLVTCCTGCPSDAVHAFLSRQTSPQQLTRLERSLAQALEYVNLVTCTRLQVACYHLLASLQELLACAGWTRRFRAIGLDSTLLQGLLAHAKEFTALTEALLVESSQTRRFSRTLLHVLLRAAQRLAETPTAGGEAGAPTPAPTTEDMDDFIKRLEHGRSIELSELSDCIGQTGDAGAGAHKPAPGPYAAPVTPPPAGRKFEQSNAPSHSLAAAVRLLSAEAERVGERIAASLSSQCQLAAFVPLYAPSPWGAVSVPELREAAAADAISYVGGSPGRHSLRCLGRSTITLDWEEQSAESKRRGGSSWLQLLWSDGRTGSAELHICRVEIPLVAASAPRPAPRLQRLRLRCGPHSSSYSTGAEHFLLCQRYDASHVVALRLAERTSAPSSGARVSICLVDVSSLTFSTVASLDSAAELPAAVHVRELPAEALQSSAWLPDCYVWASALRAVSSRGVCSVYAHRTRRLLTLDMAAEEDGDEEENEEAITV